MVDVAPGGLLPAKGTDANRLTDLLTLMSNAILMKTKQIFWVAETFKIQCADVI